MAQSYKIKKQSAADLVCEKMKELILQKEWAVGSKIPSELELAESFGVNRLTVRIALQRLHTLGLLDIRVGDGTYVHPFDLGGHLEELSDFYVNGKTVQDVVEFRLVMELPCVRMAVQRRTEEELEQFEALCHRFQAELVQHYACEDPEEARRYFLATVDTSVELHMALCRMAHNDLITYSFSVAREPMRRHMQHNASRRIHERLDQSHTNTWVRCWMELARGLRERNEELATEMLQRIIDS